MAKGETKTMIILFIIIVSLSYILISSVNAKYEKDANYQIVDARN
ncbi:MAG TPA: hypothetical protein PLT65_02155 [Bacilli bacterium]|nr:hypothetical protein [Bacilli bacterium]